MVPNTASFGEKIFFTPAVLGLAGGPELTLQIEVDASKRAKHLERVSN
jgi:hypothetical protein